MLNNHIGVGIGIRIKELLVGGTTMVEFALAVIATSKLAISEHNLYALIALVDIKFLSHEAMEKTFNYFAFDKR